MLNTHFTYLSLLLGSILFPLLLSFDKKVAFYKMWKPLSIAIFCSSLFFIVWDTIFTHIGIWSFNDQYILGFRMLDLPLEEWLFFVVIPYCSVFIYQVLKAYFPFLNRNRELTYFFILLSFFFIVLGIVNYGKWYTFYNLLFNGVFLLSVLKIKWFRTHLTHFFLTFIISFIPMFIVNGVLTSLPIVIYNNRYFSNVRLHNIPIEDFSYFFLLLLLNILIFEKIKIKRTSNKQ
jgi:lycopene cyclase domain-containing protein